ncbi:hypothetical protein ACN2C7_05645 [Caulobacter sp. ErkDOM-E]|uniref:hypothetical protein n=1 Tax=Caulobacter sp. ErkDOM-E TaxID=3402778 RepID=UPI003AF4ADFD
MSPPWSAIMWWELRRIPFNAVIALAGLASIAVMFVVGGRFTPPGGDVLEPTLLFVLVGGYAVAVNIAYTLGWISEWLWSAGRVENTAPVRPLVFRLGLAFSTLVTLAPACLILLVWAAFGFR